jgi:hypothetical protein
MMGVLHLWRKLILSNALYIIFTYSRRSVSTSTAPLWGNAWFQVTFALFNRLCMKLQLYGMASQRSCGINWTHNFNLALTLTPDNYITHTNSLVWDLELIRMVIPFIT